MSLNFRFGQNTTNMILRTYLGCIFEFVVLFLRIFENLKNATFFDLYFRTSLIVNISRIGHPQENMNPHVKISITDLVKSFHLHCVQSYHDLCESQNTKLRRRGFYNFHPSMRPKISRKKSASRVLRTT